MLNRELPNRWIGRDGSIEWPPRSPDLTICDFWLWSHIREHVYRERPQTMQDLAAKIVEAFENIDTDMIKRCFQNFIKRCEVCRNNNGIQFEQFL